MITVKPSPISSLLRRSGFRATPGRVAVLELLGTSKRPLSVKDIQKNLKRKNLDQATLYRMVNALEKAGVLRPVDFRHGHAHYEMQSEGHHHHLICEVCGKVADVSKCDTSRVEAQALKLGKFSRITQHSLEFFGVCNSCARK